MGIERGSTSVVRLDFFDMWLVISRTTTTTITCNFTSFLFAPGKPRIITVLICRFVHETDTIITAVCNIPMNDCNRRRRRRKMQDDIAPAEYHSLLMSS